MLLPLVRVRATATDSAAAAAAATVGQDSPERLQLLLGLVLQQLQDGPLLPYDGVAGGTHVSSQVAEAVV